MKVKILSDDHIEMRVKNWERYMDEVHPPYDGPLLHAGDLIPLCHPLAEEVFRELCRRYKWVFYIPGNHDYYSRRSQDTFYLALFLQSLTSEISNLSTATSGGSFRLRDEQATVAAHPFRRLYMGTMWFPDTPALRRSWNLINDPVQIKGFDKKLDAAGLESKIEPVKYDVVRDGPVIPWFAYSHKMFCYGMEQCVRPGDIVMTHHLPSEQSSPPMWRREPSQPFFVVEGGEELIKKYQPSTWIHGHTHSACDYRIGNPMGAGTRVICNPVGYPSEGVKRLPPGEGLRQDEFEI